MSDVQAQEGEVRAQQHVLELSQERLGDDQLEDAAPPEVDDPTRRPLRRDEPGHEHPRVVEHAAKTVSKVFAPAKTQQAHLFISVIDTKSHRELQITQTKSKVGSKLKGVRAKNLNYLVLVPRTIPIKLAIPSNLLTPGRVYAIRIIARDPQGNKKTLLIPFKP
jgi:hypothetical protein